MECSNCGKPLRPAQIKEYGKKHGHKRFPPKPVCSQQCRGKLNQAPPRSERKEAWAQLGNDDNVRRRTNNRRSRAQV